MDDTYDKMHNNTCHSFLNGQSCTQISAQDRGLYYGHGLFETMRVCQGQIPLWPLHLERLKKGANRLHLPIETGLLLQYRDQLLQAVPDDGILKLVVTAAEGGRGYALPNKVKPNYLLQWFPLPEQPTNISSGIAIWVCEQRLANSSSLAGIKHLNRLEQVLARAEQSIEQYPEGLMLDDSGHVIEAVSSNLFCRRDDTWLTPLLNLCGVAGVMREYLIRRHPVTERNVSLDELSLMDEVFVCNSVRGIWPVVRVDGQDTAIARWDVGEETLQWQKQLQDEFPCFDR